MIWECDPTGRLPAQPRPVLGAVQARGRRGRSRRRPSLSDARTTRPACFYRFTPSDYPVPRRRARSRRRSSPRAARSTWQRGPRPDQAETEVPTQEQVRGRDPLQRRRGPLVRPRRLHFTTKGDKKVWAYDTRSGKIEVLFDREHAPGLLARRRRQRDRQRARRRLRLRGRRQPRDRPDLTATTPVSPLIRLPGATHAASEICGVCFDPSGTRHVLHLAARRTPLPVATRPGEMFEVSGPFRLPKGGRPATRLRPAGRRGAARGPAQPRAPTSASRSSRSRPGSGSRRQARPTRA